MVYLLDVDDKAKWRKKLKAAYSKIEGVHQVFTPEEFEQIGHVVPEKDARQPDLWLAAKSGYSFSETTSSGQVLSKRSTTTGSHGFLPDQEDMGGTLVMWGYGIKPGVNVGKVQSLDVAPTMAKLLGVKLPTADGKPLIKALK